MNYELWNKDNLLQYLKSHGLWAKKGLGQNFLVDKIALDKIVEAAELSHDDFVVEVGPGVGTLTSELIKRAGEVIAVEMDEKLVGLLERRYDKGVAKGVTKGDKGGTEGERWDKEGLKIINADILKLNLNEVVGSRRYKVVANIPYYITSKILELFLSADHKPDMIVLLVQKEVAERICAKPGNYSTLAISVQLYGKPEIVGVVPALSFFPSPKVDSAILRIRIMNFELGIMGKEQERDFFRLIHIGFASRRKTLVNNLSAGYHIDKTSASDIIKSVRLKNSVRAQELNMGDWKELLHRIMNYEL